MRALVHKVVEQFHHKLFTARVLGARTCEQLDLVLGCLGVRLCALLNLYGH
jgi:hypothetical protein